MVATNQPTKADLQRALIQVHDLGANVTIIASDGKNPTFKWKEWESNRQPAECIKSLIINTEPRWVNGTRYSAHDTIGVIAGINDWRHIDIDPIKHEDGTKKPVPAHVWQTILRGLNLPDSYDWAGPSRSGKGRHIAIICTGDLPEEVQNARGTGDDKGVITFVPLPAYADDFDHIELRWERCQTVFPSHTGYNGHLPTVAPADVTIETLINALRAVATPKTPKTPEKKDAPRRTHTGNAAIKDDIKARFDLVAYAQQHFTGGIQVDGDETRILGNGGLLINTAERVWYNHQGEYGGDCFNLVALVTTGTPETESCFPTVLREAAKIAGVQLPEPDRRNGTAPIDGGELASRPADEPPHPADQAGQAARWVSQADEPINAQTIISALHDLGYSFRLNLCSDDLEINGHPANDILEAQLRTRARDAGIVRKGVGIKRMQDAYTTDALENAYHPIKDYLNACAETYDGTDHIARMCRYLTCTDPHIAYADGTYRQLHHAYFVRWMVGAVAKVFEQGQNVMLVLAGAQDQGKSLFARWLCSGLPGYFNDELIAPGDKDCLKRQMTSFIWEVGELDATTRKADVAALKAFLTKETIVLRKAYGQRDTRKPSVVSFIGTVNPDTGFLADTTGNRRFLVTTIDDIDWNYSRDLDVNQLWGQAVALYRAGESWRLTAEEKQARDTTNREHMVSSVLDDWAAQYFVLTGVEADYLTAGDIIKHLGDNDIKLAGDERGQMTRIGQAMTRLGVRKIQITRNGVRIRAFTGITTRAVGEKPLDIPPPAQPAQPIPPPAQPIGGTVYRSSTPQTQPAQPAQPIYIEHTENSAYPVQMPTPHTQRESSLVEMRVQDVQVVQQASQCAKTPAQPSDEVVQVDGEVVQVTADPPALPPGYTLVMCDHRGQPSRYGVYFLVQTPDGQHAEAFRYKDQALRWASADAAQRTQEAPYGHCV